MITLDATLRHPDGWPVLSIIDSPQTMELDVANRGATEVHTGQAALTFRLLFRPGTLRQPDVIALAAQSALAWTLSVQERPEGDELILTATELQSLAPGASLTIRLDGLTAVEAGGSRATRVQFQADGLGESYRGLIHLSVLRRHEPSGPPMRTIRTGSTAVSGPFLAGFHGGHSVLNDGISENAIDLRLVNVSPSALAMTTGDDDATRFTVDYRTGDDHAPWGLLRSVHDHVTIEPDDRSSKSWEVDHHTVRRTDPRSMSRGNRLDLVLTIHSQAPTGTAQIVVGYENLPGHDDGELVLLVEVGPIAMSDDRIMAIRPIVATNGITADELSVSGTVTVEGAVSSRTLNVSDGLSSETTVTAVGKGTFGSLRVSGIADADALKVRGASDLASLDVSGSTTVSDITMTKGVVGSGGLRIHGGLDDQRMANLGLGCNAKYGWIQSLNDAPLHINDQGNQVVLGSGDEEYRETKSALRVKGAIRATELIIGEFRIFTHSGGVPDVLFVTHSKGDPEVLLEGTRRLNA